MAIRIHGFGAPSAGDGDYEDWGFGAPTPATFPTIPMPLDLGFGDVPAVAFAAILLGPPTVPDDGGWILTLFGVWPSLNVPPGQPAGPFRVRLLDSGSGQIFPPASEAFGCYGAFVKPDEGGRGYECYTDVVRQRLSFTLPVAPPGTYDIEIAWGAAWGTKLILQDVLEVIYRTPAPEQWSLRSTYPNNYRTGARYSDAQRILEAADEAVIRAAFPLATLEALTRALAQEAQLLSGRPATRLTQDFGAADVVAHVESTLAFPPGSIEKPVAIYIDGTKYAYTTATPTLLGGVTGAAEFGLNRRSTTIPRGSLVVLDVASIGPSE